MIGDQEEARRYAELLGCLQRLTERHVHFTWRAGFADVVLVISHMQLALRHPANKGPMAVEARAIIDAMILTLEGSEPAIGPLLRMGDDPACDVVPPCTPAEREGGQQ